MKIGDKIKKRRMELEWSLRELSNRMGYANHSTIARIESGAVDIPQSKIVKFAEVLNVPVAYLMGWDESQETKKAAPKAGSGQSEAKMKLFEIAENCSEEDAERLLQMMELFLGKR